MAEGLGQPQECWLQVDSARQLEGWNIQPNPFTFRVWRGLEPNLFTNGQWLNHWCLLNKVPLKILVQGFGEIHGGAQRMTQLERTWKCHVPDSILALSFPFVWLFLSCILLQQINNIISKILFLSPVSHSSKLSNTKWGFWKTVIYSQLVRSIGNNL